MSASTDTYKSTENMTSAVASFEKSKGDFGICFVVPDIEKFKAEVNRFKAVIIEFKDELKHVITSIPTYVNAKELLPEMTKMVINTEKVMENDNFNEMVNLMVARSHARLNEGQYGYEIPSFRGSKYKLEKFFKDTLFWGINRIIYSLNTDLVDECSNIIHTWAGLIVTDLKQKVNTLNELEQLAQSFNFHEKIYRFKELCKMIHDSFDRKLIQKLIAKFMIMSQVNNLYGNHPFYIEREVMRVVNTIKQEFDEILDQMKVLVVKEAIPALEEFKFTKKPTFENITNFIKDYSSVTDTGEYDEFSPFKFVCKWNNIYRQRPYKKPLGIAPISAQALNQLLRIFGPNVVNGSTVMFKPLIPSGVNVIICSDNNGYMERSEPYEPSQSYGPGSDGEIFSTSWASLIEYVIDTDSGNVTKAWISATRNCHEAFAGKSSSGKGKYMDLELTEPSKNVVIIDELEIVNQCRKIRQREGHYSNVIGLKDYGINLTREQAIYIMSLSTYNLQGVKFLTNLMKDEYFDEMKAKKM
jgi:hypothetical protein